MESRIAKAFDSVTTKRHLLTAERKRAVYAAYAGKAVCPAPPGTCKMSAEKLIKRRKLNKGNKEVGGGCFQKSVVRYCANFMKSGVPERILFYQDGGWTDLPVSVVCSIKKDLQMKKAAVEVEFDGSRFMLDFLHMSRLDLETELQAPMAWIDEAGGCFFPEIFTDECCTQFSEHGGQGYDESSCPRELKLHLEIDMSGLDMLECTAESKTIYEDKIEQAQHIQSIRADKDSNDSVVAMIDSIEKKVGGAKVMDIYRCSSSMREARYDLFQKQAEITRKYRGDANIQSARFAAPKGTLSSIIEYGAGSCGFAKSTYGIGVHLASANFPHISAKFCDNDEKGVRHVVFCHVIVGNMEIVEPGSTQMQPSRQDFDTGVDDLDNPKHYVIWAMNANTHIFPEYVLSFKLPSAQQGGSDGRNSGSKVAESGVTMSMQQKERLDLSGNNHSQPGSDNNRGSLEKVLSMGSNAPVRLRVLIPMLFAAIEQKVAPKDMELINYHYNLFRMKTISREEFLQKIRLLAGDDLLRSTITALQTKRSGAN